MVPSQLGEFVRQCRLDLGLKQSDLATKTSLTQGGISFIESGKTKRLQKKTITLLASALGCSSEELKKCCLPWPKTHTVPVGINLTPPVYALGDQIRIHRLAMKLSQTELGKRLGITKQAVSFMELGNKYYRGSGNKKQLHRLADILQLNPAQLLSLCPPRRLKQFKSANDGIGRQIALRRIALGWRQYQLAEKIGLSTYPGQISNYETGKWIPSSKRLQKLSEVLGIPLNA